VYDGYLTGTAPTIGVMHSTALPSTPRTAALAHRMSRTDLTAFLAAHGIDAPCHAHPPVMTVAESERLVPPLPGAKTKNLFLRDRKGARHFLVTVPHALPVDLDWLGAVLGAGRLSFASAERLLRHLGITPGSVSLLALVNDAPRAVEFVIDRGLWEAPAVQAHPLRNDATMVIAHADLARFLAATGHVPRVIDVPAAHEAR
jgi:Ala-tRNA(Pro) deacylase